MSRPLFALVVAITATAAIATPAIAAPDRRATLDAGATRFEWNGGPVTAAVVYHVDYDRTLLTINTPGVLKVTTEEPNLTAVDMDVGIYKADSAGNRQGNALGAAQTNSPQETVTLKVAAGRYVVHVYGVVAVDGHFKGTAMLTPQPGAATVILPEAAITKFAKSAKAAKLKSFKGTSHDDVSVARVDIALVKVKNGKCTQMTSPGKFAPLAKCDAPTKFLRAKGTTSWSYKLKKELKKGSYVLFARATDGAGHAQQGFGPASKRAFKVK